MSNLSLATAPPAAAHLTSHDGAAGHTTLPPCVSQVALSAGSKRTGLAAGHLEQAQGQVAGMLAEMRPACVKKMHHVKQLRGGCGEAQSYDDDGGGDEQLPALVQVVVVDHFKGIFLRLRGGMGDELAAEDDIEEDKMRRAEYGATQMGDGEPEEATSFGATQAAFDDESEGEVEPAVPHRLVWVEGGDTAAELPDGALVRELQLRRTRPGQVAELPAPGIDVLPLELTGAECAAPPLSGLQAVVSAKGDSMLFESSTQNAYSHTEALKKQDTGLWS